MKLKIWVNPPHKEAEIIISEKYKVDQETESEYAIKALFVTSLDQYVTSQDIVEHVQENANIWPLNCEKLKTKFAGHVSFYVLLNISDYDQIANSDFWPEEVL